jgi:DNA repair exonuclease SbcCD ATPase subunit
VARLPASPTAFENEVRDSFLEVVEAGQWRRLETRIAELAAELTKLEDQRIPEVESVAEGATIEVERLSAEIHSLNSERSEIFRTRQTELVQQALTEQRIAQLEEDLQKNRDALKLQKFGSTLSRELDPNHCPTCEQPIDGSLLPQGTLDAVMSIEANIEYIGAQRKAFKRLADRSTAIIRELDLELIATGDEARRLSSRLRALKADLIAPSHAASASFIEERLRIEQRLNQLRDAEARFAEQVNKVADHAASWSDLLAERVRLPAERLSATDLAKIRALETSIRTQLSHYGFITFPPKDLTVSDDTYRPEKEGFEIGFELSASDSIRLKWAYQLGLLDVSRTRTTNHPGLVVFDEPRQQEAAETSVAGLLAESARIAKSGAQIVIATSEDLATVKNFVANMDRQLLVFERRLIDRIAPDA